MSHRTRCALAGGGERVTQWARRPAQCGSEAKQHAAADGYNEQREQDAPVEWYIARDREEAGADTAYHAERDPSGRGPRNGADDGEYDALGEKLSRQSAPAGA